MAALAPPRPAPRRSTPSRPAPRRGCGRPGRRRRVRRPRAGASGSRRARPRCFASFAASVRAWDATRRRALSARGRGRSGPAAASARAAPGGGGRGSPSRAGTCRSARSAASAETPARRTRRGARGRRGTRSRSAAAHASTRSSPDARSRATSGAFSVRFKIADHAELVQRVEDQLGDRHVGSTRPAAPSPTRARGSPCPTAEGRRAAPHESAAKSGGTRSSRYSVTW